MQLAAKRSGRQLHANLHALEAIRLQSRQHFAMTPEKKIFELKNGDTKEKMDDPTRQ